MTNLAIAMRDTSYSEIEARVLRPVSGGYLVRTGRAERVARKAVSCIVSPVDGDTVLLAVSDTKCFILAVLEREDGAALECDLDRDLKLRLHGASFSVVADEGVEIVTPKETKLLSHSLDVSATEGRVWIDRLGMVGRSLKAEIERVKTVASTLDQVLDRWSQRVRRSYRKVEETEQLRAGQIDYAAESTLRAHGENTVLTAEQLVKVDGEQIHLG